MDETNRTATFDFGVAVPATTGQLFVEFNRLKKSEHAAILLATPVRPGMFIIQVAPQGDFVGTVGHFILAGVSLFGWLRETVEVVETRTPDNRQWSLGGSGRANWVLIQPE